MKYPRILAAIRSAKWAVTPNTLQAIRDTLSAHIGGKVSRRVLADASEWADSDGKKIEEDHDEGFELIAPGVAQVELCGIIGKRLSSMETMCGGCDLEDVEENLMEALASPMVSTVILRIDSPGGTCNGVLEFSQKIEKLATESRKPVFAFIDGQGCSAAYWIACGCNGIACTPSSDVGSIGVYMALVDESANWTQEGYKLVLIKAGELKGAGIAGSQITPAQIAAWQADVDMIYAQFTGSVRAARPGIADETMQGQAFYGPRALEAGLVDKIYNDVGEMLDDVAPVVTAPASFVT